MESFTLKNDIKKFKEDKTFFEFYNEFFDSKLKEYNKEIRRLYYNCVTECIDETSVDFKCYKNCESMIFDFYNPIIALLKTSHSIYPSCIQTCNKTMEMIDCIDQCKELTLQDLRKIEPMEEFGKIIGFKKSDVSHK